MGFLLSPRIQFSLSRWIFRCILMSLLLLNASVSYSQPNLDQIGNLQLGTWSVEVLRHQQHGAFCLFQDAGGAVRIEAYAGFTESPEAALDKLLWRHNGGWTVILASDGSGVLNPWEKGWEVLEPQLTLYLRTIIAALDLSNPETEPSWPPEVKILSSAETENCRSRYIPFVNRRPHSIRLELSPICKATSFRQRMVKSGHGRGLNAEIIRISNEASLRPMQDPLDTMVLRSSRRPGAFRLFLQRSIRVHFAEQDPFIPMWPLGDLIRLD